MANEISGNILTSPMKTKMWLMIVTRNWDRIGYCGEATFRGVRSVTEYEVISSDKPKREYDYDGHLLPPKPVPVGKMSIEFSAPGHRNISVTGIAPVLPPDGDECIKYGAKIGGLGLDRDEWWDAYFTTNPIKFAEYARKIRESIRKDIEELNAKYDAIDKEISKAYIA